MIFKTCFAGCSSAAHLPLYPLCFFDQSLINYLCFSFTHSNTLRFQFFAFGSLLRFFFFAPRHTVASSSSLRDILSVLRIRCASVAQAHRSAPKRRRKKAKHRRRSEKPNQNAEGCKELKSLCGYLKQSLRKLAGCQNNKSVKKQN
uniref:Uncharacterized protein n=1 Tax=Pediastrum angulosum TaxID=271408 RepID=A0A2U8GHT6_9CHLO|nr:hypothetical protein [Pediastrum angulosum]